MAQGAWSAFGEALLTRRPTAVVGARFQASRSAEPHHPAETRDIARLGTDGGGLVGITAGNLLQPVRLVIILDHGCNGGLQLRQAGAQVQEMQRDA